MSPCLIILFMVYLSKPFLPCNSCQSLLPVLLLSAPILCLILLPVPLLCVIITSTIIVCVCYYYHAFCQMHLSCCNVFFIMSFLVHHQYLYTHTCSNTHTHKHTCSNTHTHTHTHMLTHTHIHTHTNTHTQTHTHKHTHTLKASLSRLVNKYPRF